MHMVKVISLSNDAYATLKGIKEKDESFSEVVLKLAHKNKKASIMNFAGIWKDKPALAKTIKANIKEHRKKIEAEFTERQKRLWKRKQ